LDFSLSFCLRHPPAWPAVFQVMFKNNAESSLFELLRDVFSKNTEQFCRPHQNGRMFSSCLCACFNRWRKSLVYSSSGWWCCSCVSSNARKTSTRCFFSITRSACSNSRTPVRYRTVFIGLQAFLLLRVQCAPWASGWFAFHRAPALTPTTSSHSNIRPLR
jgi:hypothetical protein